MTTSQDQVQSLVVAGSAQQIDPDAVTLLFYQNTVVLRVMPVIQPADLSGADTLFWPVSVLSRIEDCVAAIIPIDAGLGSKNALYAVLLERWPDALADTHAVPTRQLLMEKGFEAFSLVGRASQWINWYRSHRYCGACGSKNMVMRNGALLNCPGCATEYYPRINPCIIVLVTDNRRVLLARSSRRGTTFFSCLAGFIEPGETAEEAVAREVYEEAGIQVTNIRYVKSQPWPFPSQLMLGFYADYAAGDLNPCPEELAEAGWFDVHALPSIPAPSISVAGQLIEEYCRLETHKN